MTTHKTPSQLRSELWPELPYASDLDIETENARVAMLVAKDAYENSGLGQRQQCFSEYQEAESRWLELRRKAVRQF